MLSWVVAAGSVAALRGGVEFGFGLVEQGGVVAVTGFIVFGIGWLFVGECVSERFVGCCLCECKCHPLVKIVVVFCKMVVR